MAVGEEMQSPRRAETKYGKGATGVAGHRSTADR